MEYRSRELSAPLWVNDAVGDKSPAVRMVTNKGPSVHVSGLYSGTRPSMALKSQANEASRWGGPGVTPGVRPMTSVEF